MGKSKYDKTKILEMIQAGQVTAEEGYRLIKETKPAAAVPQNETAAADAYRALMITKPGTVDDLQIVPFQPAKPGPGEVQIQVRAFSLNFADYLCVMGLYPNMPDYPFTPGIEVSGLVTAIGGQVNHVRPGDEVIALMGPGMGGHKAVVNAHARAVVRKPKNVTFEEACAFPAVFLTMVHVFEKAALQKGEKILVQTAAGGTGLIAVQMAQLQGAEIFATAGSQEKLDYLKKRGVHHLINYRDEDFAAKIKQITQGYGVDVVINTLAGDAIQKGLDLLAPGGRYFEIAMTGLKSAKNLDLSNLVNNQTFYSFNLGTFSRQNPEKAAASFDTMVRYLETGSVKPTVGKIFPFSQIKDAYRCLQDRQNIGKIVVTMPLVPPAADFAGSPISVQAPAGPGKKYRQEIGEIAVIGMACRFPGADNISEFWQNLAAGKSAITEVPKDRWDIDAHYDPDLMNLEKTNCRWGGFLRDIDKFDPMFFNLSGKEAELMDPQQRLLLEECWKALEDAGYAGDMISNKKCGVFVGAAAGDYLHNKDEQAKLEAYSWIGNTTSITPARISYFLNLKGPSIAIDTACSSALVAIHLARQSILGGDCEMALAGGVFIATSPNFYIITSNSGMLAIDGKCKTFDDEANGFVPGEGVGVIVLKSLETALADGDHIYGIIKGSAANQDGKTNGITAPSTLSQTELEASVYKEFNINPESLTYIETHGTGTKLGDPIEIEALTNSFRKYTQKKQFCAVGSVKTNIGHTATAAGAASMIKVLLSLKYKQIPPSLNFKTPNRHIDFDNSPFYVNTRLLDWPPAVGNLSDISGMPARAAVSSFGFSGTNAHIIVEQAPQVPEAPGILPVPFFYFIPLSAKTQTSLAQKYRDLADWLTTADGQTAALEDISYTLLFGRQHFPVRSCFIVKDSEDLKTKLQAVIQEGKALGFHVTQETPGTQETQETPEPLAALADSYLKGQWQRQDWTGKFKGRRISLPVYPFERERYWLDEAAGKTGGSPNMSAVSPVSSVPGGQGGQGGQGPLHILIDSAAAEPGKLIYKKRFTGAEYYIQDHGSMLPGVVYMEMARAAGALANQLASVKALKNVIWSNPILFEKGPKEVIVNLYRGRGGNTCEFDIISGPGAGSTGHNHHAHCRGILQYGTDPDHTRPLKAESIDIQAVLNRCPASEGGGGGKSGADEYFQRMAASGGKLGPRFKGIQEFYYNRREGLSRIGIIPEQEKDLPRYTLHPTLTDAALQSMAAFGFVTVFQPDLIYLPYVLGELEIIDTASRPAWVYVTFAGEKFDTRDNRKFNALILDDRGRVLAKMKEFSLRPVRQMAIPSASESSPGMLYCHPVWQESAGPGNTADTAGTAPKKELNVLVFDINADLSGPLKHRTILVKPGKKYRYHTSRREYEINPGSPDDYEQLAASLLKQQWLPDHILHHWSRETFAPDGDRMNDMLQQGVYSLVHIIRSFNKPGFVNPFRLSYLFEGSAGQSQPLYAAVGGFIACARLETGKIHFKVIEILHDGAAAAPGTVDILRREIEDEPPVFDDIIIRYRDGQRFVKRLQAIDAADTGDTGNTGDAGKEAGTAPGLPGISLRENGVYLITGGLGQLGFLFAQHLAAKVKARLVLTDRFPLTADKQDRIRQLETMGATVRYIPADLAVRKEVTALAAQIKTGFNTLNGILHAAGINRDSLVINKKTTDMDLVLAPKVYGTVYLDEAFAGEELDFFLMFSSTTAQLGYIGQGDYGYANNFMDHFAHWRENQRLQGKRAGKTLAVDWPSWQEGGMKMDKNTEDMHFKTFGVKSISTQKGMQVFQWALEQSRNHFMILGGDPAKIRQSFKIAAAPGHTGHTGDTGDSPLQTHQDQDPVPPAKPTIPTISTGADIRQLFQKDFIKTVSSLLRIPESKITLDRNISEYGFDSISFTDLSHKMNGQFHLGITPDIFFNHSSLGSVFSHLLEVCREPLLEHYRESIPAIPGPSPVSSVTSAPSPVSSPLPVTEPAAGIRQLFQKDFIKTVSSLLRIPESKITLDRNISEYGFDSISFTDLSHKMNGQFRLGITPDIFFNHSSLGSIFSHLLETCKEPLQEYYRESAAPVTAPAPPPIVSPVIDVINVMHEAVETRTFTADAQEPAAIIGIHGVMPQSEDLDILWQQLVKGKNLITEIPPDRWDWREFYGDTKTEPGKSRVKWGGFMKEVDKFDSLFFNISPKEAETMDPQLRILLEVLWETIEDAGYKASDLSGANIGIFIGATNNDYVKLLERKYEKILQFSFMLANRSSYYFNFNGPSESIDTACSSSLVAVHRAAEAIHTGACDLVLAGGVNVIADPHLHTMVSKTESLSESGRCYSFDKRANGYVRSEGVGAILLKRLSLAEADGDHIYAVIRGSAVNHCGHTNSPATPNPVAQSEVIISAHRKAGFDPTSVSYIETHGTGTSLGDPIEINGLKRAFEHLYRDWQKPVAAQPHCGLGTVKTGIGHLEPAAGIAGMLHVILAMKHGVIPGNINFQELNPYIKLQDSPFYIIKDNLPWTNTCDEYGMKVPRRAGVSSFGIGGTNAHVVLEEWTGSTVIRPGAISSRSSISSRSLPGPQLIVLSAKNRERLNAYAGKMVKFLEAHARYATYDSHAPGQEQKAGISPETSPAHIQRIQAELVKIAAAVINVAAHDLQPGENMEEYGFDAVKQSEFLERISGKYDLELPPNVWVEAPTLEKLAAFLCLHHPEINPGDELCQPLNNSEPVEFDLNLMDVAYTLQVGREPLEERLAVIVSTTQQLYQTLSRFCGGEKDLENGYQGNIRANKNVSRMIVDGKEGQVLMDMVINERKLDKLAQMWIAGVDIDWQKLHVSGVAGAAAGTSEIEARRISLPTYPFAGERYWLAGKPRAWEILGERPAPPYDPDEIDEVDDINVEDDTAGDLHDFAAADTPDRLLELTLDYLKGLLAPIIKMDKNKIDTGAGFEEFGMDSLMINQLNHALSEKLGDIPATLFFKYKSLDALAGYLIENYSARLKLPAVSPTRPKPVKFVKPDRSGKTVKSKNSGPEDIAIIGVSGQYPMAPTLEQFWANLEAGRNCIVEIPLERWDYRQFYDPKKGKKRGMYCHWGGFLDDVDKFDPLFFNISPLEARYMDPHERLFLQTVWACFEDAGYTRKLLESPNAGDRRGSVGVFAGATFNNYQLYAAVEFAKGNITPVNSQLFSVANRVSYIFNLSGPSLTVDTACSSSLYALHLACESIRHGECEMAVAGGVNLSIHPSKYVTLCEGQAGSSLGHCDAFGEGGDGYVPAEAVGAILLKPLSQAIKDGDRIYAKIKSTTVNHDGKTYGYSVPNPVAQAELVKTAITKAGIDPATISFVEAHGTGTSLGDPIEIQGLTDAFGAFTDKKQFCSIGSVKSNIGHAEAAAGIAQVTKVILQMKHKRLTPSLIHSKNTNPNIDFNRTPFIVQKELAEWKQPVGEENGKTVVYPRRAGVSSFGIGGVNVHAIMEEYRDDEPRHLGHRGEGIIKTNLDVVIPLSAKREENLRTYARNIKEFLEKQGRPDNGATFMDFAYTLQVGREPMPYRLAFTAQTMDQVIQKLELFLNLKENDPAAAANALEKQGIYYHYLEKNEKNEKSEKEPAVKVKINSTAPMAEQWVQGVAIDWKAFYNETGYRPQCMSLPTYPFSREPYWFVESMQVTVAAAAAAPVADGITQAPAKEKERRDFTAELAAAPESERYGMLSSYLQKTVGKLLEFIPPNLPDFKQGFFDMGIDSILSAQLYTQVEQDLKVELYPTATFDYPNIAELSRYLMQQIPFDRLQTEKRKQEEVTETTISKDTAVFEKIYFRGHWEPAAAESSCAPALSGNLLIFDTGEEIFNTLRGRRIQAVLVKPGSTFKQVDDGVYEIDPGNPGDYRALIKALDGNGRMPAQVIHYWSKENFTTEETVLRSQLKQGIYSVFYLTQALLEQKIGTPVRMLYVYDAFHTNDGRELIQPQYEALRGFARSVTMENPHLVCRTLERISAGTLAADMVLRELGLFRPEDEPGLAVRWSGSQRWVKCFRDIEPAALPAAVQPNDPGLLPLLKENGVYVITGGAGGVGLLFAEYIAANLKTNIVLTGRSELTPDKQKKIAELQRPGSQVVYIKADVSRWADTERLISETRRRFRHINGIIHSAGLLRDSFIVKKTAAEIEAVFAPKVFGTMHLDGATKEDNLDFFIPFSSMVSVFGNGGQCDYAYANNFVDAFARWREDLRARGLRKGKTTAVNWTNWRDGGMKVDERLLAVLRERFGIIPIGAHEGIEAFAKALVLDTPQLGFVVAEREKMDKLMRILPPLERAVDGQLPFMPGLAGLEDMSGALRAMSRETAAAELENTLKLLGL